MVEAEEEEEEQRRRIKSNGKLKATGGEGNEGGGREVKREPKALYKIIK